MSCIEAMGIGTLKTRTPVLSSISPTEAGSRSLTIPRNEPPFRGRNNRSVFRRDPLAEIEHSFFGPIGWTRDSCFVRM